MRVNYQTLKRALIIILLPFFFLCFIGGVIAFCTITPIANWFFKPVEIQLTQKASDKINLLFEVQIPENLHYVKGFELPHRDPTYIYLFEADLSEKPKIETVDDYIYRLLSIKPSTHYLNDVSSSGNLVFKSTLMKFGYSFTKVITPFSGDFAEIYYKCSDSNTMLIAFIYGVP